MLIGLGTTVNRIERLSNILHFRLDLGRDVLQAFFRPAVADEPRQIVLADLQKWPADERAHIIRGLTPECRPPGRRIAFAKLQ